MGWVADCAELAVALGEWAKKRYQSKGWKKKLETVSADLLREDVDLRTAHEAVRLAHQAGYAGPELVTVEERIAAIEAYERKRAKPPRAPATKMRKKRPSAAPGSKRLKKKKKPAVKKAAAKGRARKVPALRRTTRK